MKIKMKLPAFILTFCAMLMIMSCSWTGLITGVHTKLLYEEFEAGALTILDLPLHSEDMAKIEAIIESLDNTRIKLGNIHEQAGGNILLSLADSVAYLDDIKRDYMAGYEIVSRFYEGSGKTPPLALINYHHSAVLVYDDISTQVNDAQDSVQLGEMVNYLGLVLRVYAQTNGVPL